MSQIQDEINRLEETLKQLEDKPSRSQFEENQIIRIKEQLQTLELQAMTLDELNAKKTELESQEPLNESEYKRITNRINELELEQQQAQAQQEREQAQAQEIAAVKAKKTVTINGENLTIPDDVYELLQIILDETLPPIYQKHNDEVSKLSAEYQDAKRAADDRETQLQRQNDDLQEKLDALNKLVNSLNFEKQDAESKRDAAVKDLESAKAEIDQHKSHIDDLRLQLANAPAPKAAVDIGSDKAERAKELVASITKRYVDVKPVSANWYEATAEDGSKDVVHKVDLPKIEVLPFRDESAQTQPHSDPVHATQETPAVGGEQFHTQNEVPAETVQAPSPAGDLVSETVSRSEFEALQQRVEALEKQNKQAVA